MSEIYKFLNISEKQNLKNQWGHKFAITWGRASTPDCFDNKSC